MAVGSPQCLLVTVHMIVELHHYHINLLTQLSSAVYLLGSMCVCVCDGACDCVDVRAVLSTSHIVRGGRVPRRDVLWLGGNPRLAAVTETVVRNVVKDRNARVGCRNVLQVRVLHRVGRLVDVICIKFHEQGPIRRGAGRLLPSHATVVKRHGYVDFFKPVCRMCVCVWVMVHV